MYVHCTMYTYFQVFWIIANFAIYIFRSEIYLNILRYLYKNENTLHLWGKYVRTHHTYIMYNV